MGAGAEAGDYGAGDPVQAYKWLDLASTRSPEAKLRESAAKSRVLVAAGMSPAQKTEAQRLAKAWKPKNNKLFIPPSQ